MKFIKRITISAMLLSLGACGSSNNNSPITTDAIDPAYQGIWLANDKGLAIKIGERTVENYMFTSDFCFLTEDADEVETRDLERYVSIESTGSLYWFAGYGPREMSASGFELISTSALPNACETNLIALEGQDGYQENPEQTFSIFSQIFEEYYMDFDLQNVDWTGLKQTYSAGITQDSTNLDLMIAMDAMIKPLRDAHTSITSEFGTVSYNNKQVLTERLIEEFANTEGLPYPIPGEIVTEAMLENLQAFISDSIELQKTLILDYADDASSVIFRADGDVFWFVNEGIGYLHIGKMIDYHPDNEDADDLQNDTNELASLDQILDEALSDLQNVDGLILDIRTNNGGHDFVSLAIANRFTDGNVLAYTKKHGKTSPEVEVYLMPRGEVRYTGPIALLVSASTVSAAETFALSMSELDNVVLIGEATQGAFSDIMNWELPQGFDLGLSSEYYYSANGSWLEGQGVPVDIDTSFFSIDEREQEYDAGIEAAIDWFKQ